MAATVLDNRHSDDAHLEGPLSSSTTFGRQAIAGLQEWHRELLTQLARSESEHGPTGGHLSKEHLLELMKTDTPLARIAFGIFVGEIKVSGTKRRVAADDIIKDVPEIIVQCPHLREEAQRRFFDQYCYGLDEFRSESPVSGEPVQFARSRGAYQMFTKDPGLADFTIQKLASYKDRTHMEKMLDDEKHGERVAETLLAYPDCIVEMVQDFRIYGIIAQKFPQLAEAAKAKVDRMFEQASQKKAWLPQSFVDDLIYNHAEYRERAFQLALVGYSIDQYQTVGLFQKITTTPPTPELKLRAADHLLQRGNEDHSDYWGHMHRCVFVFKHASERREAAWDIIAKQAPRKMIIEAARAAPEYLQRALDVVREKDAQDIPAHKKQYGTQHPIAVISRTEVRPFFDQMVDMMNETDASEVATSAGRYIIDSAANKDLVGYQSEPWRYADVVANPSVDAGTREEAWQKLSASEFYYLQDSQPALLQVVSAEFGTCSAEAARKALDYVKDVSGLRTLVEHTAILAPDVHLEAARKILAHASAKNADFEWVRTTVPQLASDVETAIRPSFQEVLQRIRTEAQRVTQQ